MHNEIEIFKSRAKVDLDINMAVRCWINYPYKGMQVITLHSIAVIKFYELHLLKGFSTFECYGRKMGIKTTLCVLTGKVA